MASSATVGILRVLLSANTAEFDAAMKKAASSADGLTKTFKSIGQQATDVGMTLTKTLTVPLLGLGVGAAKAAIDFESAFANVAKTVDGVSDKFGKLTPVGQKLAMTFRQMAKEIPATTDELTKIAALGGQMGVPIDQLEKFTKNVAALGVAVDGISTEEAASGLAAIGNATGTGTTKIAEMASALVHLGNNSNATEGQILEMTQRLIGAANAAKFTVPETMALATSMANVGINAEAGGTAMSTVIAKISKAVSTGSKDLEQFAEVAGKTGAQFAEIWKRSPIEAMDLFIKGLGRMKKEGADLNLTMGEIGTEGIRVASTLKLLAGATQSVSDTTKLANEGYASANKHLEEAHKKYETTANKLTVLWNRIKDVGITLGNALLPGIKAAIAGFESLLPILDGVAKMLSAMPGGVQLVVIGLAALLAAAGPVLIVFGQLATAAASVTALFGKKGIATRLLAGDLITLEGASTRVTTALGLLGKAAAVAGAAFVGWQIGRLIADLTGLDQKIADSITGLNNLDRARKLAAQGNASGAQAEVDKTLLDLTNKRTVALSQMNLIEAALLTTQINSLKNDQTRLAIQDSITLAIKRGADANITYAAAIKFNEEWTKKAADSQAWWNTQVEGGGPIATKTAAAVSLLAKMNAAYADDLKKIGASGFKEIQKAHDEFGVSVKDLAKQYGVAESSIDHYLQATKKAASATKEAAKEIKEATDFVFEFNKNTKDLEDSMAKMDAAAEKAFKNLKEKGIEGLNDDARQMVAKWQKAGEEAGQKLVEGLAKSNKKFHDEAAALQRGLIDLEEDSLEKRQALIRLEAEEKRHALDKNFSLYQQQLDLINAQEAKALGESEKQWKASQAAKSQAMIDSLGRAFEQLANISGQSTDGILHDIGEIIGLLSLADKAGQALADSFGAIGKVFGEVGKGPMSEIKWKDLITGIGDAAAAAVSAIAVIGAATDPSHRSTAQTTASGALAGAKLGSKILPGWGTAIGAGVGALVGWWRGSHAEWKKVAKDIGKDIGQDISDGLAQSIAEMAKTLEGGTKQQRREMAELFSLDAIIAEAGGLTSANVQKYEKEAAKLFDIIQRGGENGAKATQELNTLIGQFAAQAAKTGGMWDPVFKNLIAQSKALGLNIDGVTAAIDGQISKLSGGLVTALKGAFVDVEKRLAEIKLSPEQIAAIKKAATVGVEGLDVTGLGITQKQIDDYKKAIGDAQGAFDRLSRTALASFNAIVASGRSVFDAIAEIGPAIDILIAKHDELGLAGGAAFDQLARFRILTEQNKELVASVGGLNDVLVALNNLGGLNVETLADLEAQGLSAFEQLQAAGFTEAEALKQMAPLLKSIIQAHYDLGIPIDENTQKVIDLARANGVLEEDSLSLIDVLKEGFAALITAVGGTLPDAFKKMGKAGKDAAKDVADGINKIPKTVDIEVNYHPGDPKPEPEPYTPPPLEPGDTGRRFAAGGPVYAAYGRLLPFKPKGTDTVPALLTPGEGVLSVPAMQTLGRSAFDTLNAGINPLARMSSAQPYQRTGTDGGGPSEVYVDVTVTGEIISSRDRAIDIGKSIAVELRKNADLRDVWRTPIKGITESGL